MMRLVDRPSQFRSLALRDAVLATLLAIQFVAIGPALAADERVRMAGSFNGWNTADDSYLLKPAGKRLERVGFWPAGRSAFKFVWDGSWNRHLGSAGAGDSLVQPGNDVELTIPSAGCYAVWLDTAARRWGVEPRDCDHVHAIFRVLGGDLGRTQVELNASGSLARRGRPITLYQWAVRTLDPGAGDPVALRRATSEIAELIVGRPGRYEVSLTVGDGEQTDTAKAVLRLGVGWRLSLETWNADPRLGIDVLELPCMPLTSDGRFWGGVTNRGFITPIFKGPAGAESTRLPDEAAHYYEEDVPRLIKFDTTRDTVEFPTDGFHQFEFKPASAKGLPVGMKIERVDLVGDFNAWRVGATPLFEFGDRTGWLRILELPDGIHHYRFVVNGTTWLEDPAADPRFRQPDGKGGFNSGVLIGDDASKFDKPAPDRVDRGALKHDPQRGEFAASVGNGIAAVTLRTLAKDIDGASLRSDSAMAPMHRTASRGGFDYWTAQFRVANPDAGYDFVVVDGKDFCVFDEGGAHDDMTKKQPFKAQPKASFETPDWAKTCVWYQIFPERFRNGEPSNDPASTVPWQHEWYKPYKPRKSDKSRASQTGYAESGNFYDYIYSRRFGGDLQGIREKLPYLKSLGITAIYLNPIFQAESLHKYDASDYRHIDDAFGIKDSRLKLKGETEAPQTWQWSETDRLFLDFLKEAHALGFKVVLDGVFNHVGREFWAFKDVMRHKQKSKYVDWFDIVRFEPFHYKAWDRDDGELPRLKHDDALGLSPPVREHIFAITKRWMDPDGDGDPSDGIDGWRLDVAADVNEHFWRDWRKLVKGINPQAYIVAEIWEESKIWLQGDCFDAVMNYEFARRVQRFFVDQKRGTKPSEFGKALAIMLEWYAPQVNYVLQNLFDSHDTDRIASMCMNPDLDYDKASRLQDTNPRYTPNKPTQACYDRVKLAVTFQMTFLGAPMVWYGNEVGMYGADDPSCRKPMLWEDLLPYEDKDEKIHEDVREHHRRMIAIRNTYPSLQLGAFEELLADDALGVYAFARTLGPETIVVVVNNSDNTHRLNVPIAWVRNAEAVRLDDPKVCAIVDPPPGDPKARPIIRRIPGGKSSVIVEDGKLHGAMLAPRTGGVFLILPK